MLLELSGTLGNNNQHSAIPHSSELESRTNLSCKTKNSGSLCHSHFKPYTSLSISTRRNPNCSSPSCRMRLKALFHTSNFKVNWPKLSQLPSIRSLQNMGDWNSERIRIPAFILAGNCKGCDLRKSLWQLPNRDVFASVAWSDGWNSNGLASNGCDGSTPASLALPLAWPWSHTSLPRSRVGVSIGIYRPSLLGW